MTPAQPQWLDGYRDLDVDGIRSRAESEGRPVRVVGPGELVTMEHLADRVTVWTDDEGRPERVTAG